MRVHNFTVILTALCLSGCGPTSTEEEKLPVSQKNPNTAIVDGDVLTAEGLIKCSPQNFVPRKTNFYRVQSADGNQPKNLGYTLTTAEKGSDIGLHIWSQQSECWNGVHALKYYGENKVKISTKTVDGITTFFARQHDQIFVVGSSQKNEASPLCVKDRTSCEFTLTQKDARTIDIKLFDSKYSVMLINQNFLLPEVPKYLPVIGGKK